MDFLLIKPKKLHATLVIGSIAPASGFADQPRTANFFAPDRPKRVVSQIEEYSTSSSL
tara:strand:+ start:562 stop:735 length:174 start_codon:yes stop_codon:yes gene_type:complete